MACAPMHAPISASADRIPPPLAPCIVLLVHDRVLFDSQTERAFILFRCRSYVIAPQFAELLARHELHRLMNVIHCGSKVIVL